MCLCCVGTWCACVVWERGVGTWDGLGRNYGCDCAEGYGAFIKGWLRCSCLRDGK